MRFRGCPSDRDGVQLAVTKGLPTDDAVTRRLRPVARTAASLALVAAAFFVAAWTGGTAPFHGSARDPYATNAVVRAIPFDAPLPYDKTLMEAGRGPRLPYHVRWTSDLPPGAVSAQVREHLAGSPRWELTQTVPVEGEFATTLARSGSDGYMTHFAELSVAAERGVTVITFDFTPIPTTLAPE